MAPASEVGGRGVAVGQGASGCIEALRGAGNEDEGGGGTATGRHDVLVLFDIDGTLTQPRQPVEARILEALVLLRDKVLCCVGGGGGRRGGRSDGVGYDFVCLYATLSMGGRLGQCVHVCMRMYWHMYMYMHMHMHMYMCMYMCTHMYVYV